MDAVKLGEIRKKRTAEPMAELKELKAELKELEEERSLPGAKVIDGKLVKFLAGVGKKQRAALREEYSNREPPILRLNSQEDPCCTAASPPGVVNLSCSQVDIPSPMLLTVLPAVYVSI